MPLLPIKSLYIHDSKPYEYLKRRGLTMHFEEKTISKESIYKGKIIEVEKS